MDPILMGAIATGVGSSLNSIGQIGQNKKSRQFATDMYRAQRQDALHDFHMINQYNDPSEQMARLQKAGINPAVAFSKGATPGIAGQVRSSDVKNPTYQNPNFGGIVKDLPQAFDFKVKQATSDNIQQQRKIGIQQQLLLAAKTRKETTDADISEATKSIAIDAAQAELNKTEADTKMSLDENERRAMLAGGTLAEKMSNVALKMEQTAKTKEEKANLKAMRREINSRTDLNQIQSALNAQGVYKNDSLLARWIAQILDSQGGVLKLKNKLEKTATNYFYNK